MRTKTLLLTAALSAAGVATSMAQVYSVNAVGYVNTTLSPGYNLISNPLDAADNTIPALFNGVPANTQVFVFDGATYVTATFFGAPLNSWNPEAVRSIEILPGDGVFVSNPTAEDVQITFVGEVPQGGDSNQSIPAGLSIQGSTVPQTGTVADLEFPAAPNDQIYKFDPATQAYTTYTYFGAPLNRWSPEVPVLEVGEAVFVSKEASATWDRNFDINATE